MKSLKALLICAALALPMMTMADNNLTNKQLIEQYKHEINIKSLEIKTVKAKMKADPADTELAVQLVNLQNELQKLKADKKALDAQIRAQKAADRAQKKLKAAQEKAEIAAQKAKEARTIK